MIVVKAMTWEHARLWHSKIQPMVDNNYKHWSSGAIAGDVRADVGWDWRIIFSLVLAHNSARYIPGNQSGPAQAFAMVVTTELGEEVPIGMLTVVPEFYCNVKGASAARTFVWYLADAPVSLYRAMDVYPVSCVAAALVDTAIQSGLSRGTDGSLLLHADPNGGDRLAKFYLNRCKMTQLPLDNQAISFLRRKNTDQYFFMHAAGSTAFCAQFDQWR